MNYFWPMRITNDLIYKSLQCQQSLYSPLQSKMSIPIVSRLCQKMVYGLKFKPIWISSEGYIVEGHHRYIASIITNYDIEAIHNYPSSGQLNVYDWKDVDFVLDDWDTPSKIDMLNREDALYNDLSLEEVEKLVSKNN